MEILDLLNEESVSGARSSRANLYIRREVLLSRFEKVSRSLKYDSNFFSTTDIYIYIYIYMDTTTDHFTPLTLRVRGKNIFFDHRHIFIYIYGHHDRSLYPARAARAG